MLRIRVKMGPQRQHNIGTNSKEWTCCFGLHVHTATIMIGLWHLFLNILALSLLAIIWRNPHMMEELETGSYDYTVDLNAPALPTPLSKVDPPYAYRDHSLNYKNFDMGGLVCTCMIAITLMMIYGTLKGKPSHLLPFFCLQLFDFAITSLTAAGYLCYLQAIHRIIADSHRLPWREKLLELSPEQLVVVVLIVFVCIVFLKAYSIGIVWRCYKYLTLRQQHIRTLLPCVLPDLAAGSAFGAEERAYSTLLPNYDEAIAQYMKQAPPPSYQVAMSNYQTVDESAASAAAEALDNNNDTSNNNNTVHINANTPPMQRIESQATATDTDAADIEVIDAANDVLLSAQRIRGTDAGNVDNEFDDNDNAEGGNTNGVDVPPPYNSGQATQQATVRSANIINIPGQVAHSGAESQA